MEKFLAVDVNRFPAKGFANPNIVLNGKVDRQVCIQFKVMLQGDRCNLEYRLPMEIYSSLLQASLRPHLPEFFPLFSLPPPILPLDPPKEPKRLEISF